MASRSLSSLRLASRLLHSRTFLSTQPPIHRHHPLFSIIRSPANDSIIHRPQFSLSSLSFSTLRRHQPSRGAKKLDIGAKARQLQTRRLWTYALAFSGVAGFLVLVLNNFQDQLVFYVTPTDAFEKLRSDPTKTKFRLGGLVLEGSVNQPAKSPEMEFVVTDLVTDILVRYQGSLPDLFREGHSVVVEGFVKPLTEEIRREWESSSSPDAAGVDSQRSGGRMKEVTAKARSAEYYFSASEVLAKHDEKYMPAEVAAAIEKNKKMIEAEAVEAAEERKKQADIASASS